ncbi:hypothetical protein BUALT_Bualt18G0102200 [Buddleja alternifolia]|uniref:Uncharacterized protein n=1 Tax=Buddleja alternifolia TaxID=168488 RepID=A0AAV6WA57_9LAMI|nr:hypothetical protein BUALT_Bualt18G0102200 [Buddleja alternifolia]
MRKRGITTGISVEKKRRKGEKLEVTIHPHRQRIVGHNAKEVKTEICVVLKQHAPLQSAYWKDIPIENKKKMWLAMKRDPETEQEPTRTDTWRRTRHSVKKNGWVDEASREAHEDLTRLQSQPIEDGQNPMTKDEAFIVVFGEEKSNRLRGCGDGLKPPSKRGQRINKELEQENEELKKKAEEDREALESLKKENKDMASRLESLESQVNNQEAQVNAQVQAILKSQLPAIIQNLGTIDTSHKTWTSTDHRIEKIGRFGGSFVPEILVQPLSNLADEFRLIMHDPEFQRSAKGFRGKRNPLCYAHNLTDYYKNSKGEGPEIYLKREDLNHSRAHKMNNAIAQVMLAKRTFKDAESEAIRYWVKNLDKSYCLTGTGVGPYLFPNMVRELQSIIGKETRKQTMQKWAGKPDVMRELGKEQIVVSIQQLWVKERWGVYHGAMSYLLQDDEGQIIRLHLIGVRLEYPGVSPELSFLKDVGRAEFHSITDEEAMDGKTANTYIHTQEWQLICGFSGSIHIALSVRRIVPALEAAHALAYLAEFCPPLPNGSRVVVNCSGRGDKEFAAVCEYQQRTNGQCQTLVSNKLLSCIQEL